MSNHQDPRPELGALVRLFLFAGLVCLGSLVADVSADTVVLHEGQTLTGRILSEKDTKLYLDIGLTVIDIPRDKILRFEYSRDLTADRTDANDANDIQSGDRRPAGHLYRTASLTKTTIKQCAERVSEADVHSVAKGTYSSVGDRKVLKHVRCVIAGCIIDHNNRGFHVCWQCLVKLSQAP